MTVKGGGWSPATRLALAGSVLVAFALRLYSLGDANLWWDEALAVWAVRKTLVDATLWTASDVHPPVYFWSLWAWIRMVGEAEWVVRWVSVAYGVATVPLAGVLAARLLRFVPRSAPASPAEVDAAQVLTEANAARKTHLAPCEIAALVTAGVVALSRFEVWWSMELRMYVAAGAFVTLAAYAASRWWTEPARKWTWLGVYVGGAWLALHTIYLAGAALLALNVGVLMAGVLVAGLTRAVVAPRAGGGADQGRAWFGPRLVAWAGAQVAVIVATVPWLAVAVPAMSSWRSGGEPATATFVAHLWLTLLATGESTHLESAAGLTTVFWVGAAAGIVGLVALAIRFKDHAGVAQVDAHTQGAATSAALLVAPVAVVPAIAVWAATQPRSIFYSPVVEARYLVPFAPPVYALIGAGLAALVVWAARATQPAWSRFSRLAGASLAGGAVLVSLAVKLPGHYQGRVWTDAHVAAASTIWSLAEEGDVVLLLSGNRYPMASYVYDRQSPPGAPPVVWSLTPTTGSPPGVGGSGRGIGAAEDAAIARGGFGAPSDRPSLVPFPDEGGGPVSEQPWRERLERVLGEYDRVWLWAIEPHLQDPDGLVRRQLESLSVLLDETYGPDRLTLYGPERATGKSGPAPRVRRAAGPRTWARLADDANVGSESVVVQAAIDQLHAHAPAHVQILDPDGDAEAHSEGNGAAPAVLRHRPSDLVLAAIPADAGIQGRIRYVIPEASRWPAGPVSLVTSDTRLGDFEVPDGAPVAPERPMQATIGGAPLSSAGWPSSVRSGEDLVVDLVFSGDGDRGSLRALDASGATLFVHLLGPTKPDGSVVWAVGDARPPPGMWRFLAANPEELFLARHVLTVPPDAPPGRYEIEVGAYDSATVERFPVSGPAVTDGYVIDHEAARVVFGPVMVGAGGG